MLESLNDSGVDSHLSELPLSGLVIENAIFAMFAEVPSVSVYQANIYFGLHPLESA